MVTLLLEEKIQLTYSSGGAKTEMGVLISMSSSDVIQYVGNSDESDPKILVGIPAYNEERTIANVVLCAKQYCSEVIVVDDGSFDRTSTWAQQVGATVLQHERNRGKGAAVKTLFQYIRPQDFDVFVLLDGDGQHLPSQIPSVIYPILKHDVDITIGSRYAEDSNHATVFHRRIGQKVLDYVTRRATGICLTDTQSGFRAFSPQAVNRLSLRSDGMGVESEMICIARKEGLKITERSISVRYNVPDGQTYNSLIHGCSVLFSVIRFTYEYRLSVFTLLYKISHITPRYLSEHGPSKFISFPTTKTLINTLSLGYCTTHRISWTIRWLANTSILASGSFGATTSVGTRLAEIGKKVTPSLKLSVRWESPFGDRTAVTKLLNVLSTRINRYSGPTESEQYD